MLRRPFSFTGEADLCNGSGRTDRWGMGMGAAWPPYSFVSQQNCVPGPPMQDRCFFCCREASNSQVLHGWFPPTYQASIYSPEVKLMMCKIIRNTETMFQLWFIMKHINVILIYLNLSCFNHETPDGFGYFPYKIEFRTGDTHSLKPITRTHSLRGS